MKTVRCPQCNLVCWNTVLNCSRCSFDIQSIIETEPSEFEQVGSYEQNVDGHFAHNLPPLTDETPKLSANIKTVINLKIKMHLMNIEILDEMKTLINPKISEAKQTEITPIKTAFSRVLIKPKKVWQLPRWSWELSDFRRSVYLSEY